MHTGFKRSCLLLLIGLLGLTGASAEGRYVTIDDIREETRDGWHETYTIGNRTLTVDIGIEIPDVNRVPAVRIKFPDDICLDAPAGADVVHSDATGFVYYLMTSENPLIRDSGKLSEEMILPEPGAIAENSPLTPEEAEALYLQKIAPYIDISTLQRNILFATTRKFEVVSMDSDIEKRLNFDAPTTDTGCYQMEYFQTFHGIPYVRTHPPFNYPFNRGKIYQKPDGRIDGMIATQEDYMIGFLPAAEDGVIAQDLPLAPFAEVKQAFEELILGGYVWAVYFVRLEYVGMDNPDDMGNSFILVPVWEMNCRLVESPQRPDPDALEAAQRTPIGGCQPALVNAQTAVYYDPMDSTYDRATAKLIVWEQAE